MLSPAIKSDFLLAILLLHCLSVQTSNLAPSATVNLSLKS